MAGIDHQPFVVRLVDQDIEKFLPNALVSPADETAVRVAPTAIRRRQIAPRGARPQNPEDGIDKLAIVFGNPAPYALAPRQVRLQQSPGFIGYIVTAIGRYRVGASFLDF